jgi:hypothetical protein
VTVTTAEGGRGHDYRIVDPEVDEKGGLLLILTWVPWSEREWIQFLGRTGRQDRHGQYAVFLDGEDETVADAVNFKEEDESLIDAMLRLGDEDTAERFAETSNEIIKGRAMHQLTSRYWASSKNGIVNKDQTWQWKRMCETYMDYDEDELRAKFDEVFPSAKEDLVDPEIKPNRIPKSSHTGENKWNNYLLGHSVPTRKPTAAALPANDLAPSQKGEASFATAGASAVPLSPASPASPTASVPSTSDASPTALETNAGERTDPAAENRDGHEHPNAAKHPNAAIGTESNAGKHPNAAIGTESTAGIAQHEPPKAGQDSARRPPVPKLSLGALKLAAVDID